MLFEPCDTEIGIGRQQESARLLDVPETAEVPLHPEVSRSDDLRADSHKPSNAPTIAATDANPITQSYPSNSEPKSNPGGRSANHSQVNLPTTAPGNRHQPEDER